MNELAKLLEHDEWPKPGTTSRAVGWFDVAELVLTSGSLWVGDPDFSWAELAGGDGNRVALDPGRYAVRALVTAFGDGNFVARLRVCAIGADEPKLGAELARAGTDSAAIGVCDAEAMLTAYRAKFGDDLNEGALFLEEFDFERAGFTGSGMRSEAAWIFSSAVARAIGSPAISPPTVSALNSRERLAAGDGDAAAVFARLTPELRDIVSRHVGDANSSDARIVESYCGTASPEEYAADLRRREEVMRRGIVALQRITSGRAGGG